MDVEKEIKTIEEQSKDKAVAAEDYEQDGLLYCGKCHTPKQYAFEYNGHVFKPRCNCKCESERYEREQAQRRQSAADHERESNRQECFGGSTLIAATFERDDGANKKLSTIARNYADNFAEMKRLGKGLLFFGEVGTGKTFLSACIANAVIDKGYRALVTNFATLTNTITGSRDRNEVVNGLNKYHLLVIDDLASERDTEFMGEIVQTIIDSRYRSGLPVIVTTNLSAGELKHPNDIRKQRIFSRLFEICLPFEVQGVDRRKETLKRNFDEMKSLLGL